MQITLSGATARKFLAEMKYSLVTAIALVCCLLTIGTGCGGGADSGEGEFATSESCRECHERFYQLWAPSHHGMAMQPWSAALSATLPAQPEVIEIGGRGYGFQADGGSGWMIESGPEGEKRYRIEHALGGKNVYYFLTSMERGRLQVMPLAFDLRSKKWFDTTASMIRHFANADEEPVHWTDRLLTFNTSCHSCHVSQLSTNYDLDTDTYRTTWREPGINCETCHGGGAEHIRVCREAASKGDGAVPDSLAIISVKAFDVEQTNAMCAPCHAKAWLMSTDFRPGDRYFDHFGLTTFEHPDFYPDGRDLGENYTYTAWLTSPCVDSGRLDCLHCHTSSGRYRFTDDNPNEACRPCHGVRVATATDHTRHAADGPGNRCVSCHMPSTEFARMKRSDHSMLPPVPAATIEFGSPNACNICHQDQDAAWAVGWVREWFDGTHQAAALHRARLIDEARDGDWTRLPEMLSLLRSEECDQVRAATMIRLLRSCPDERKWSAVQEALEHDSPLVRAAAATALSDHLTPDVRRGLLEATEDDVRLVRISAAAALAAYPRSYLGAADAQRLNRASAEYVAALRSRPDDWSSHYNLGNYLVDRGEPRLALAEFETASRLEPRAVAPRVNASMVYARLGDNVEAEDLLRGALAVEPGNPTANFNLGLLLAEKSDSSGAERCLRRALAADPDFAEAAYNLCVLIAESHPAEAIEFCRRASRLRPDRPRYGFTLGFYLDRNGYTGEAVEVLKGVVDRHEGYADAYFILGEIYEAQNDLDAAAALYSRAAESGSLAQDVRVQFSRKLRDLETHRDGR